VTEFIARFQRHIQGHLSCCDRLILQGRLPILSYAEGITRFLTARGVKIFDFVSWAKPLTDSIKQHAEAVAQQAGLQIDYVPKKNFRKEDKIESVLRKRGMHCGLVWVFSALEPCTTYAPKYNPNRKRAYLSAKDKKCLHYYFYFIDEAFGLCYLRVPTWCPFRLQFYCNLHQWLARRLEAAGITYQLLDNAFVYISDWGKAQQICDSFDVRQLHERLLHWVELYCPSRLREIEESYNWTLDTVEYASDVVFDRQQDLQPLYQEWIRTAIHTVKPQDIATFLGKKWTGQYPGEMGNRYNTRLEGTRLRHSMGLVSINMYDKFGHVLRIETTVKDVTFFRHYRRVEHRDGSMEHVYAPMKKTIYSFGALREAATASNRRYLAFLAALADPRPGLKNMLRVTDRVVLNGRSYRGLNFFAAEDVELIQALAQGEFCIRGMRNKTLRQYLPHLSAAQLSRALKRLRLHGLIHKTGRSYSYYLTPLGRSAIAAGLRAKEFIIRPELAQPKAA
jgi:hypothetical protein